MARDAPTPTSDILLMVLSIFIPPAGVFIKRGCNKDLLINVLLTILAWLPGVIHALWVISKHPDPQPLRTSSAAAAPQRF